MLFALPLIERVKNRSVCENQDITDVGGEIKVAAVAVNFTPPSFVCIIAGIISEAVPKKASPLPLWTRIQSQPEQEPRHQHRSACTDN